MVMRTLKLGYNVVLSDVDVYWFKNPMSFLTSSGPSVLVAQTDEYNSTGAINLPQQLNSGFYYAHSENITIAGAGTLEEEKNEGQEETISIGVSGTNIWGKTVRKIHACGRIEMYADAHSTLKLIENYYPGMCIARPNVFKCVHESVLKGGDILLPANKYFIVRCTTMEKLKRRQSRKPRESEDDSISISSAREFFLWKESWLNCRLKKQVKENRVFVPPIQRSRFSEGPEWEPNLTSIQEMSR